MRLVQRGIQVDAAGPTLNVFPDGAHYYLADDMDLTLAETRRFSTRDADALVRLEEDLGRLAGAVVPYFERTAPDPRLRSAHDLRELAHAGRLALKHRRDLLDLAFLFTTSATQFLEERFESEHVMAAIGWHAINDSVAGPSTPGTAFVLLHDHASEETGGGPRAWGFVRSGMGRLTEVMADAAREAGAEIRTDAEVERILTVDGRATGVALASGEEIRASRVLSNADPKRTFLGLVDERDLPDAFLGSIRAYRCMGTSMKINLAVSELPMVRGLPEGGVQPYHTGIMEMNPFIPEMDMQQAQARAGIAADPAHVELCFPTVHDPSLAPEGKHVITIDVNSQPYDLRHDDWDDHQGGAGRRRDRADRGGVPEAPGSDRASTGAEPAGPRAADRAHGRPRLARRHVARSTPVHAAGARVRGLPDAGPGLYLCGAGTHPGGGVTGANGRNAAREVLRDAHKKLA